MKFLEHLHGKTPSNAKSRDKRGWGPNSGKYTTTEGYNYFQSIPHVPPDPTKWKFIWNCVSLPKIDFFVWTLAHNNILTNDNLKRRGWEGPSRCTLCQEHEETANHLFLQYQFAKDIWTDSLKLGPDRFDLPDSVQDLLTSWAARSLFNLRKKELLKTTSLWFPKFICWKI